MGFFKKIFKPFKNVIDSGIDLVTDTAKYAINLVTSPFTGGFNVPDISIPGPEAINNELTLNYNSSNSPIPVLYGRRVETSVIPIYVKTWGNNNQYLTIVGAISTGLSQTLLSGAFVYNITIDGEQVGQGGQTFATTPDSGPYRPAPINVPTRDYGEGTSNYTADQLDKMQNVYTNPIMAGGFGGDQPMVWSPVYGRFSTSFKCQFFNGSDDQPISSLAAQAGFDKRLPGIFYGVFQFHLRNEKREDGKKAIYQNPYNGLPQITVITDGRNVPDITSRPQTNNSESTDRWDTVFASGTYNHLGGHNNYGTTATGKNGGGAMAPTHNPVHHLLDYMMNPYYGMGLPVSKFDKESWVSASQCCRVFRNNAEGSSNLFNLLFVFKAITGVTDILEPQTDSIFTSTRPLMQPTSVDGIDYSDVALGTNWGWAYSPYARQFKIYPDRTYLDNINTMLTSMGANLVYTNGKFKIKMENAGNPKNSFDQPSTATLKSECDGDNRTFTDDEIVGSVTLNGQSLDSSFNQVKINFPDFEKESKSNSVVYPEKDTTLYSTLLQEDNDQELTTEITNLGIFHYEMALVYAKIILNKSRNKETISFVTTQASSNVEPGDIIRVNSDLANIDNLYRVTDVLLTVTGQIEISGFRHIPTDYDFDKDNLLDYIKNIFKVREPIIRPQDTRLKPVEGIVISKVRKETDTDLLSLSMDQVVRWIDKNNNPSENSYEVKLENIRQNNVSYSPRVLGQVKDTEFKFSAEQIPQGATFTIGVTAISPSGDRSEKATATGNNVYIYGGPVSDTPFPQQESAGQLSSGGDQAQSQTDLASVTKGEI